MLSSCNTLQLKLTNVRPSDRFYSPPISNISSVLLLSNKAYHGWALYNLCIWLCDWKCLENATMYSATKPSTLWRQI